MLLTIIEIVVFMVAAAILGVALGWVLRGTLGREQIEISDLRAQLRQLKKTNRESQAASKSESAERVATVTRAVESEAPKVKAGSTTESKPKQEDKKAAARPATKEKSDASKAAAKVTKKNTAKRKSKEEREADQAAGRAAFAEVVSRIGESDGQDKLTKIYGIGKKYEAMLNDMQITSYAQVAKFRKVDLRTLAAALGVLDDRIETEDWVGGAKQLLKEAKK